MGLIDQWAADAQRKSDERAARWQQQQRDRNRTGQMTLMDRWAARAQRKSNVRAARWMQRQHEKALSGRMTFMDRWAARAQRKSDEAAARWLEMQPLWQLLYSGPARGPGGSTALIYVQATGDVVPSVMLTRKGTLVPAGAGGGGVIGLVYLLISRAIWLAFHRSYTVHVHTNGSPPNVHVRLPSQLAAYRAAAELVSRFQAEGHAAVESWRADTTASIQVSAAGRS